jgi:hypothetical protein
MAEGYGVFRVIRGWIRGITSGRCRFDFLPRRWRARFRTIGRRAARGVVGGVGAAELEEGHGFRKFLVSDAEFAPPTWGQHRDLGVG